MLEHDLIESEAEGVVLADASLTGPYDVTLTHAPEGGWAVQIRWEYGYRYDEIYRFEITRKSDKDNKWHVVTDDLSSDTRFCADLLPDNNPYTYRVTAVTRDGQRLESPPAMGNDSEYISVDPETAKPTGIRKPLASTSEKVFIAGDFHPQATGYLLEALDSEGASYLRTRIADPQVPIGLLIGRHPADRFTAQITVLRRGVDGREYAASKSRQEIDLDNARAPHLTVYDFFVQEPEFSANRTHGAVLALAEGSTPGLLVVNGVPYQNSWCTHNQHHSAIIHYVAPIGSGIVATLCGGEQFESNES